MGFGGTLAGAMVLAGLLVTDAARDHLIHELELSLETQARLARLMIPASSFTNGTRPAMTELAHSFGRACGCRVTLIRADGLVLGDSELSVSDLDRVENHKERPEVREALAGGTGHYIRHSVTVGYDLLYTAIPLPAVGAPVGIVRFSLPLTRVHEKTRQLWVATAWASLIVLVIAGIVALWLSTSISRPVAEIAAVARRMSEGDYSARVQDLPADEHGALAETMNELAQRVRATIDALSRETAQLSAILANMVEGVVAIDSVGRVVAVNPTLAALFGVSEPAILGKPLLEAFRHSQLNELLRAVLKDGKPRVEEMRIFTPEERVFEAHAATLTRAGTPAGALLVLHDITRTRKLEQLRREFVANVSHELRTPLTSIKGFVETLRQGAAQDEVHRDEFLEEIEKASERLMVLVDDLLELAAIESGKRPLALETFDVLELAQEAALSLKPQAEQKHVSIDVERDKTALQVRADRIQIQRVLTNLLDNGIKYNLEHGKVFVRARAAESTVTVEVRDTGPGIPPEDLRRVFERFYRVDKGRSVELGGTGLGLSIVKHIVEAHGGAVAVESKLGAGATFSFSLPKA